MSIATYCLSAETKTNSSKAIPLILLSPKQTKDYLKKSSDLCRANATQQGFEGKEHSYMLETDSKGSLTNVLVGIGDDALTIWSLAHLPTALPKGKYILDSTSTKKLKKPTLSDLATGWGAACYKFSEFKESTKKHEATLLMNKDALDDAAITLDAIFMVRDLINMPVNHMQPTQLAAAAKKLAKTHKAQYSEIIGDNLLKKNYPAIHAVGRASDDAPRLVDMRWGNKKHPTLTLVGKGVCFDTGGLDIKSSSGMIMMKKDMGGAAHVLGLASMIMAQKLPLRLRVLVPCVENSISANAFRPSDVLPTRKGITVEVGNTDAEGRLILCDALAEADTEKPDLLIDCATLTGAARVALGAEIPAFFTNDKKYAATLQKASDDTIDPLWQLPLYDGYKKMLNSEIADTNNISSGGYGGAITAALFLQLFVEDAKTWVHLDMMAWNLKPSAGKPIGGEAMGIRALYASIINHFNL